MKKITTYLPGFLVRRCPKSGRIVKIRFDNIYAKLLFPLAGILALVWFLVRVIPKPSRAAYPCQQVAMGIGVSFVLYITGIISSLTIYEKIRKRINKPVALIFIASVAMVVSLTWVVAESSKDEFIPVLTTPEGPNAPMGEAKGMFPGRVAWIQDFNATSWDEKTGSWWDDNNTNQLEVNKMISKNLQCFTGAKTDKEAWQKIFEFNNKQNGRGKKGYTKGEKIVIKVNMNAVTSEKYECKSLGYPSPHMVYALISQLINVAGVPGNDIIITDPSRYICNPVIEKIRANASPDFQGVIFEEKTPRGTKGFVGAEPDTTALVWFTMPKGEKFKMCFPKSFSEATYIINYSVVRPHRVFGITSASKNLFGSVWCLELKTFNPKTLHAFALWNYPTPNKLKDAHCHPVLLGHKITNSKTILYMSDGLYTAVNQSLDVTRMSSFNNDWFSSLLISQDPVALESVVYDFISNEPNLVSVNPSFNGNQDNPFQESALANDPPSGTKYDPENDGTLLKSLGVHEHWNNNTERKYSQNLGKKKGIELVTTKI